MVSLGKGEISERRVLLVEDEVSFRNTLRNSIKSFGYACTEARSAHEALAILRRTQFPIVISDDAMLEMDGLESLHIMRKVRSGVDVLIITGFESSYSPLEILQAGASDFLAKPFSPEHLAAKLYRIWREKALKDRLHTSAITDELTGLSNRRAFYLRLRREVERAKQQDHPLALIMFDVDGFKGFNDRYGHLKGDILLKRLARMLRFSIREHLNNAF